VPPSDIDEPRESEFCAPLGEQLLGTSTQADPLRIVIAREQLDAVLAARQTMTASERQVLAGMVNDKSQRQLAAEIGWPRKTVMLAQRSAREKLAAQQTLAA
jgi:FixJ family two-component response regulator